MILHILLFLIYSVGLSYALLRMPFVRKSGIRPAFLLLFFALHVSTGLLHNIIAWRYYPAHGDIWYHFQMSFLYRQRLTGDFHQFIADNNTWTYFTHNSIIFINMVLNLFSADNLAVNTLLFSFPVFLGSIALFHTFRRHFPRTPFAALAVLLLPSTIFWTACIHREGILYMLIGFLCYTFSQLLPPAAETIDIPNPTPAPDLNITSAVPIPPAAETIDIPNPAPASDLNITTAGNIPPAADAIPTTSNLAISNPAPAPGLNITSAVPNPPATNVPNPAPSIRQYLTLLILLLLISYFRIVVTLSLLPGLFIWWTTQKKWPAKKILLYSAVPLLLLAGLLYCSNTIQNAIINRQHEFLAQESHSRLPLPALDHSWHSVAQLIPRAFINGLFQPLPGSGGQVIYTAFSLELLAIWAVTLFAIFIVLFCLYAMKQLMKNTSPLTAFDTPAAPFAWFCVTTSIIGLLLIGCMIPAAGAIVRYRSIYLPLLLAPSLYILREGRPNRWLEKHLFLAQS